MIELTLLIGQKAQLDGKTVLRIRGTNEYDAPGAKTLIDWVEPMVVIDEPDYVAGKVQGELPTLRQLQYKTGKPVWFNGAKASGPYRLLATEAGDGVKSAFVIGGKRQLVANTHQEVAAAIGSAKGDVLPIPSDGLLSLPVLVLENVKAFVSPPKRWN
ncbi:hypothetical protein [Mesorhizobium escarrei]|uniref:Uncharacterized protein n=1 Tax=Mesorhizobium escarrei TaxID=666018 RepID=A0ABM9E1S4_9HYPH|nr:hypothetical protein [Mesorhizobium escarrei]CAH2403039.1 conserved hypothetical protein [Mesorhizobium escarrei]